MESICISVFISSYNEERSIVPTIESISDALVQSGLSWEIIVVDDASSDKSAENVRRFLREHATLPIRLDVNASNRGLVPSIFATVGTACGQYFWVVAGDNNVGPETAAQLLSQVGSADIVIPRVMNYSGRTLHRRIISITYAFLVRLLSGCPVTYYNGSSIHRRSDLVWLQDKVCGFAYAADCITRLWDSGCSFVEVPVFYKERASGKSSALTLKNLQDITAFLFSLPLRRAKKIFYPDSLLSEKRELG